MNILKDVKNMFFICCKNADGTVIYWILIGLRFRKIKQAFWKRNYAFQRGLFWSFSFEKRGKGGEENDIANF